MYYLIEISTGDSRIAGRAVYTYESENGAVATFHSKLGTAMKSEMYDSELVMVITMEGNVIKREYYTKPIIADDTIDEEQ